MDTLLKDAAAFLATALPPSPLLPARAAQGPGQVALKCEMRQPTGSFKIRGATYVTGRLAPAARAAGVVAYSTGNHAQAVARAAAAAGLSAKIVMSPDAPEDKRSATAAYGAEVIMAAPSSAARRALAETLAAETGAALIPPYDDLRVIAGQGSIGFELHAETPQDMPLSVYVPIGGGGLIAGLAAALHLLRPGARVIGVEPALEDDAYRSLRAQRIVAATGPSSSMADAIKVQALGELTFPLILAHVHDIWLLSEAEIAQALRQILEEERLVVEPAAALAYAAARRGAAQEGGLHVALLTGGNIPWTRLATLLA